MEMSAMLGLNHVSARGVWHREAATCILRSKGSQLEANGKASSGKPASQCKVHHAWASGYAYNAVCCSRALIAHLAATAKAEPVCTVCPGFTSYSADERCFMRQ